MTNASRLNAISNDVHGTMSRERADTAKKLGLIRIYTISMGIVDKLRGTYDITN